MPGRRETAAPYSGSLYGAIFGKLQMDFIDWASGLVNAQQLGAALAYFAHSAWGAGYVFIAMMLSAYIGVAAGSPMPAIEGVGSAAVFSFLAPAMPAPALMNVSFGLAVAWYLWVVFGPNPSVLEAWCMRRARRPSSLAARRCRGTVSSSMR